MMLAFFSAALPCILAGRGTEWDLDTAYNLVSASLLALPEHLVSR